MAAALDWDEAGESRHARLLARYRRLSELRRAEPALTDPDFTQEEKSFLVNAVKFVRQHRAIRRQSSK